MSIENRFKFVFTRAAKRYTDSFVSCCVSATLNSISYPLRLEHTSDSALEWYFSTLLLILVSRYDVLRKNIYIYLCFVWV